MTPSSIELQLTAERLEAEVERGTFCTGAQAYVSLSGGEVLSAAYGQDGLRRPMTVETVSTVYCALKPMIAVLVLLAEQEGDLDREMTLSELLDGSDNPAHEAITLRDLLTHQAGLHTIRSPVSAVTPPALRREIAMRAVPPDGWDRRRDAAYSEWLGFYLVGQVLERVNGIPLRESLRERVLRPLEIDDEVSLGLEPEEISRIGINVDLRDGRTLPLLSERAPWFVGAADPSLNAYATMRGLGRFYRWVLETLSGRGRSAIALEPERLRDACRPHRPVVHDQMLETDADWGLGFMSGLGRLGFGTYPSPRAVGHSGQVGTSLGFCDPEHDLGVAVLYNGVIDQRLGVNVRRPEVVSAIYQDLGIEPATTGLSELEAAAIRRTISSV
ncbi:MAG: serine hydrolase domain-containing protein [Solirubrobacterales bacterium]